MTITEDLNFTGLDSDDTNIHDKGIELWIVLNEEERHALASFSTSMSSYEAYASLETFLRVKEDFAVFDSKLSLEPKTHFQFLRYKRILEKLDNFYSTMTSLTRAGQKLYRAAVLVDNNKEYLYKNYILLVRRDFTEEAVAHLEAFNDLSLEKFYEVGALFGKDKDAYKALSSTATLYRENMISVMEKTFDVKGLYVKQDIVALDILLDTLKKEINNYEVELLLSGLRE